MVNTRNAVPSGRSRPEVGGGGGDERSQCGSAVQSSNAGPQIQTAFPAFLYRRLEAFTALIPGRASGAPFLSEACFYRQVLLPFAVALAGHMSQSLDGGLCQVCLLLGRARGGPQTHLR